MARVAQVIALVVSLASLVPAAAQVGAGKEVAEAAFASPAAPAAAVSPSLRAGGGATVLESMGTAPKRWADVKPAAAGGHVSLAILIFLPIVILFGMFVAKSMGGLYPNCVVC
eukprot:CAMPEP_0171185990 /NCGR_PEP_ID=MMETSP0790-20130122/16582_1 /TAXON_ID=2925 /ORGANISM="Alexandrium catenella, Strain OF101" /LENGTH=112 /DNA_ID=CAMNT_0011651021 /DNA_START=51 /DNA_END=386 /DNA_ORIENTATION=-